MENKTETKPKDKDEKAKKKPKKKSSSKIDKSSIIFYVILLIGILTFIIIMIVNNKKQHYTAYFGEDIKVTIDLKDDKFILSIYADSDIPSKQEGTYKIKEDKSTEVTENNSEKASNTDTKSKVKTYIVTFDDNETAEFTIDEEKGTLLFKKPEYTLEFKKGE